MACEMLYVRSCQAQRQKKIRYEYDSRGGQKKNNLTRSKSINEKLLPDEREAMHP